MITFKAKTENGVIVRSTFHDMVFPAGEAHIKRDPYMGVRSHEIAIVRFTPETLNSDLFALEMWDQCLDLEEGEIKRTLIMPYLPGARADKGTPNGAATYALFIARLGINHLITVDPHSEAWLLMFKNACEVVGAEIKVSVLMPEEILTNDITSQYDGIIAPDKGAVGRASAVADKAGLPVYTCSKERNFESGKLMVFNLPENLPAGTGKYLIVDDICDGGGTFAGLALEFFKQRPEIELDLYVTHGVFSKDARHDMAASFGTTYTTNSYNPNMKLDPESFTRIDILTELMRNA